MERLTSITDRLEHFWEDVIMKRIAGSVLVAVYLLTIVVVEFNRQGFLPPPLDTLPSSHFYSVEVAFTLLLITEIVSLVFALTRSFSRSVGIQLEILSLILLRDTFKEFTGFSEPLEWETVVESMGKMTADALGALAIFVILGVYYRIQKDRPISKDEEEQAAFINYKKVIALGLLITFISIGVVDIFRFFLGLEIYPFFSTFYTILIFTDILMVLLSLRYGSNYSITFRNFGYAVVTVFIRLSLIAPTLPGVAISISTALFALAVSYAYNAYISENNEDPHTHEAKESAA